MEVSSYQLELPGSFHPKVILTAPIYTSFAVYDINSTCTFYSCSDSQTYMCQGELSNYASFKNLHVNLYVKF